MSKYSCSISFLVKRSGRERETVTYCVQMSTCQFKDCSASFMTNHIYITATKVFPGGFIPELESESACR